MFTNIWPYKMCYYWIGFGFDEFSTIELFALGDKNLFVFLFRYQNGDRTKYLPTLYLYLYIR